MRILLVEDDRRIARFVAKGLREQAYAVDVTGDGDDALYKLSINDYDAVILDVMIPGRDGFQVCRDLRSAGIAVPVIMLTARDTVLDRIKGLDSGADDYLIKPFAVAELLARLRALLRRGQVVRPATIRIADLFLDTRAQRATRSGRELSLTTKEYALLEYLAREEGRVVSRTEIAEHVWDENFDPLTNLIDVHINRLRRKVDNEFSAKLIHTRRGAGYILTATDESASSGKTGCQPSRVGEMSTISRIKARLFGSMRSQLTIWYSGVLALVLLVFAVTTYSYLARAARQRTDESLSDTLNSFISNFNAELGDENQPADEAAKEAARGFHFRDRQVIVFDGRRNVVVASEAAQEFPHGPDWFRSASAQPQLSTLMDSASRAGRAYSTVFKEEHAIRALAAAVPSSGQTYFFAVATPLRDQEKALMQAQ